MVSTYKETRNVVNNMGIKEDFALIEQNRKVAELTIKIRAGLEYTKRVLDEQIAFADESITNNNFSSIPLSIRTEGQNILGDMKTLRNHLNTAHVEFLTI